MSVIKDVLEEEYERAQRAKSVHLKELNQLAAGSLVKKIIKRNVYHYLQWYENGKVVSRYVKNENLDQVRKQLEERKALKNDIRNIDAEIKNIERLLKHAK